MFGKKTYESLTAQLRNLVDDLHAHADTKTAEALDAHNAAQAHLDAADAHRDEAQKARTTAGKIGALLAD